MFYYYMHALLYMRIYYMHDVFPLIFFFLVVSCRIFSCGMNTLSGALWDLVP